MRGVKESGFTPIRIPHNLLKEIRQRQIKDRELLGIDVPIHKYLKIEEPIIDRFLAKKNNDRKDKIEFFKI